MSQSFNVATYNVAHCHSFVDRDKTDIVDVSLTANVIRSLDAQIVGLNEIYCNGDFYNHPEITNQSAKLAVQTEFPYHAFARGQIFGVNGEDIGNAILSKHLITKMQAVEVKSPDENHRYEFEKNSYFEDRVLLVTEIELYGKKTTVISTHFGLNLSEQEKIVRVLCDLIDHRTQPLILMGDFNASPDAPVLAPIYKRLSSTAKVTGKETQKTFSSYDPTITIDYIFLSEEFETLEYEVINSPVSDHFPIRATIKFK